MYGGTRRLLLKNALIADQEVPDSAMKEVAELLSWVLGVFLRFNQWRKDFLDSLSPGNVAILQRPGTTRRNNADSFSQF